jgi:hypothetical protein
MPTVVIVVAGAIAVQGGAGESEFRLSGPGGWFASSFDEGHTLTVAEGEAHVVEVEVR